MLQSKAEMRTYPSPHRFVLYRYCYRGASDYFRQNKIPIGLIVPPTETPMLNHTLYKHLTLDIAFADHRPTATDKAHLRVVKPLAKIVISADFYLHKVPFHVDSKGSR
jgi:hypothetical protein